MVEPASSHVAYEEYLAAEQKSDTKHEWLDGVVYAMAGGGRLPRNHEFAGKEYPRELVPPKYREKGLRFKSTGYPDFEPHALTLPNGKKAVRIELTGSRRVDELLANRAAGLERTPKGHTWHHVEDEGTMVLVPRDLHEEVAHTGGRATFKHRTGVDYGD
jgi:hypothetical protein